MSYVIFGVGFLLFFIYIIFLIWNLIDNPNKSKKPEPKIEYDDNIDYDGIGNQGRI